MHTPYQIFIVFAAFVFDVLYWRMEITPANSLAKRSNIIWRFEEEEVCSNRQSTVIWGGGFGQIVV